MNTEKKHPMRRGQKFERHQWEKNPSGSRVCTVCGERQIKVSGRWEKA